MFVKTLCFTNLDLYKKEEWPNKMWSPAVGEMVESKSGAILKIVRITHCIEKNEPYLKVELHAINEGHFKHLMGRL